MAQKNIIIEKTCFFKVVTLFVFAFLFLVPGIVGAASLYISPSSNSYSVGSTFNINVYVSSNDQSMNAVSGTLSFPQDKLEVISISKTGSIVSLWVQDPSFSNILGTATFEGIVLNPGFTGSSGKIITANLRVKGVGSAIISFSSGSILANDGSGTNILTALSSAQFTLSSTQVSRESTSLRVGSPIAPRISSVTHSDSDVWYRNNKVAFSWPLTSDITGARLLVGEQAVATPTVTYVPAIGSKDLTDLELKDGIWYFHVRLRNAEGWGAISNFRFQIDTKQPEFEIIKVQREDNTEPRVRFIFAANDAASGIASYEVKINNGEWEVWRDDGTQVYETPVLDSGTYTITVRVKDRAGNTTTRSADFTIESLSPPIITEYTQILQGADFLVLRGTTFYAESPVQIWIQKEEERPVSYSVKSDKDGDFIFTLEERMSQGTYEVWAQIIDDRGASSEFSNKVKVTVTGLGLLRIGSIAVSFLAVLVPLLALVFFLVFIIWYGWYKVIMLKKRLRKEIREAESGLHNVFALLKEDIADQIKLLEKAKTKRDLTKEEDKIIRQLKKNLNAAERVLKKEIKDIKKEVD